jgi:hypothetical protein
MESRRIVTRLILPPEAIFAFAGDGLSGRNGELSIDAGAGFGFSEWGRLILKLLDGGGLGFKEDALCINPCEVSSRIAGKGLSVRHCKLNVDFGEVTGVGLTVTEDGDFALDLVGIAGTGFVVDQDKLNIDTGWFANAVQSQINNNAVIDPAQTVVMPYTIDVDFRYKPNGYGYNSGIEVIKKTSSLVITKNAAGVVMGVTQGPVETSTQDFDFDNNFAQNAAEREETPATPNFYAK